ncbi:transglycosylase domain-containing protein [Leptolyngbya cf. ectocarpi LEGE 11479]|uniref:Transglycosylase domain-containing protein n=1 Tax=Leptolyngbya cf. ectocarpi LEGE 11479 TaxID=1828722 RepID=A0A929FD17_LEPEC|nr:transglycosylase domain-containing protein [Leptolyngbya ectocarpi]MBE9070584.1 transglycosylase domain-containing protein [Leptolyngbya cf. ectocarpi LEGE 11479]
MTQPPRHNPPTTTPRTILGTMTQVIQNVARVDFNKLVLKPGARVPKLVVEYDSQQKVYDLVGDHYVLGRSSKNCDIVVRSPLVSQTHLTLTRDRNQPGNPFVLKDKKSTNGTYCGKKRLKTFRLQDGDILSLGPKELNDAVTLRFQNPAPWYLKTIRYGLYGVTGSVALATFWVVAIEWPKIPIRPIPESVQGPVSIYGNENGDRVLINPVNNQAHIEKSRLREYSRYLPQAVIASEDSRYHWHLGVDPWGIARAAKTNLRSGTIREGASTLTQQMARNIYPEYVGRDDSAMRKIREMIVAFKLETFFSKNRIMLLYLNRVYLGNNLYGFEDASQFYFDKSAKDLNIQEAATLVGILPAPNAFNPVQSYDDALDYRNRVIERMTVLGMINQEEGRRARRSRIEISPKARRQLQSIRAPYFYSYIFDELDQILGLGLAREGNFYVETSLDLAIQTQAETSMRSGIANLGDRYGFSQGALVTVQSSTGEIQALVGGADYSLSQFNRASQAVRQPGSTFKIFAYASALEQGISPSNSFGCGDFNWGGQYYQGCRSGGGSLDMYSGFARSENVVALRIAREAGLDNIANLARTMGIESELDPVPGMVLGQSGVTPLEMTGAVGAIANNGVWNRPHGIQRVLDSSDCADSRDRNTCRVIFDFNANSPDANQDVLTPSTASTMTTLMRGTVDGGTGSAAYLGLGEAGKTGTTNDNVDLWFVGFVPSADLVTGIWLGNDNNDPTYGSSSQAAQLWSNYMGQVVR